MHAHSHITWTVAAMNSCFPCNGAYQHGIAVEPLITGSLVHSRLLIRAGGAGGGGKGAEITHSNIEHDPQLLSVEIKGQLKK